MKKQFIGFLRYRAPAFVWALLIYIASSVPSGRIQWWLLHRYDKILHMGIFFILGVLVYRALHGENVRWRFSRQRILLMLLIVLGYGLFDELHQGSTPGRTVDFLDFLADAAGGALAAGTVLVHRWFIRREVSQA